MHYVAMMFLVAAMSVAFGGHSAEFSKAASAVGAGEFGRALSHVAVAVDKTIQDAEPVRDRAPAVRMQPTNYPVATR